MPARVEKENIMRKKVSLFALAAWLLAASLPAQSHIDDFMRAVLKAGFQVL